MRWRFFRIHPTRGGWWHWHEFFFNGGNTYFSYRIGPFLFRRYERDQR